MFGLFRFLVNGLIMLIIVQELFHPELAEPCKWHEWIFFIIAAIVFNWKRRD